MAVPSRVLPSIVRPPDMKIILLSILEDPCLLDLLSESPVHRY